VLVALTIIVYVLSISRIFLAGAGSLAVIFATIMTVGILAAATYFANSKMRSSSIGLAVMGSLMTISLLGMVSIGGAEHHEEEEEELPPAVGAIDIVSGNLFFRPSTFAVPVGTIELDVFNEAGTHNITFDDPNLPGGPQPVEMEGTGDYTGEINFPAPGDYTFYCSVPGHRAGGMEGVITADESLTPAPPEGESGETEAGGETPAAG
jgi:plastocyanin